MSAPTPRHAPWPRRLYALAAGLLTHALFLAAVAAMAVGLHEGMATGLGRLHGPAAWAADALLALQFGPLHSLFLSCRGRRLLARLGPRDVAEFWVTPYAAFAALQILLAFAAWSPSGTVWWRPSGALLVVWDVAYGLSWLLLLKAMADAGLAMQTGFAGWAAALTGRRFRCTCFPPRGLFRRTRQPVYLAFALVLWTAPTWTPDRLLLTLVWTGYCLHGPRLKEARYLRRYGDAFRLYQREVPYWLPRLGAWKAASTHA